MVGRSKIFDFNKEFPVTATEGTGLCFCCELEFDKIFSIVRTLRNRLFAFAKERTVRTERVAHFLVAIMAYHCFGSAKIFQTIFALLPSIVKRARDSL